MTPDARDTVLAVLTVLGFVAAALAGMWRLWLKPFLQRELFEPVQDARKNVTENHHSNEQPTMPDRLDDLAKAFAASLDGVERRIGGKVDELDTKIDGHLISAAGIDAGISARMLAAEQRLDRLER